MTKLRCTMCSLPYILLRSSLCSVPGDLVADVLLLGSQLADLMVHRLVVCFEEGDPLGDGPVTLAAQLGIAQHLRDRHAGIAQAAQYPEPIDVVVGERAPPARRAGDVVEQADTFVVAQRVEAESGLVGNLPRRIHARRIRLTWSALRVALSIA